MSASYEYARSQEASELFDVVIELVESFGLHRSDADNGTETHEKWTCASLTFDNKYPAVGSKIRAGDD